MKTIVFSRTLRKDDYPKIAVVATDQQKTVAALKASPGKDIWLFGGGSLFRSLAEDGLVDTVEIRIVPILLGVGIPLSPDLKRRIKLALTAHNIYQTGIVSLEYAIQ
jgi:dihydrofolate reductase